MADRIVKHKNFESDTVHGHNTHLTEQNTHSVGNRFNRGQSENANKVCDDYDKREMQKERESVAKKAEYRDYLLMQMRDKEIKDKKSHLEEMPSSSPFSEDFLNANEKYNLKLMKQKETRQDLDDCVKMKHNFEMKSQRVELEEEQERSEFWKKRHDDNIQTTEKAKIEVDRKEHSRNENALLWMAEERKDIQREKLINYLLEKDKITDLNEHQKGLSELQKSIRLKKELLKENEDKINEWMKNLDFMKNKQEKLKKDIEKEEELKEKLELKRNAAQN